MLSALGDEAALLTFPSHRLTLLTSLNSQDMRTLGLSCSKALPWHRPKINCDLVRQLLVLA